MLVMIAAVVAIGPFITRRLGIKTNLVLIGGYLALLITLSVICIFIPSSALKATIDREKASQSLDSGNSIISAGISAGSFDAPEDFTKTETSFEATSDRIHITGAADLFDEVYVGTKGVDIPDNGTNKIEVYTYVFGDVSFNGTYYPAQIDAPTVILDHANHLYINAAAEKSVDLYQFDDLYAVHQFSGTDYSSGGGNASSSTLVIVLLPSGVTAEGSGYQPLSSFLQSVG